MAMIQILLHIPEHIQRGLHSGIYVRNAAGIIRWAAGEQKGGIVMHLREVGGSDAVRLPSPTFLPVIASAAIQLATVTYLDQRLARIEGLLEEAIAIERTVLAELEVIKELQFLQFTKLVGRGYEHLQRCITGKDRTALLPAATCFREGFADVRIALMPYSGERILEELRNTRVLFQAAAISGAGEMQALILLDAPLPSRRAVLESHGGFWKDMRARLDAVPGPTKRFPSLRILESCGARGPEAVRKDLLREISAHVDAIDGEIEFLEALSALSIEERKQLALGVSKGEIKHLCVLRNDQPRGNTDA